MPTYQYACTVCGERIEAVQKFSDAPLTQCPACAGRLRKVFAPVGIVFKGSGFYRTDNRAANGAGAKEKQPAEAGAKAGGQGTASDGSGAGEKKAAGASGSSSSAAGSSSSGASSQPAATGGKAA